MSVHTYKSFKIRINPESDNMQGLRVGDVVRRQYFDGTNVIYSLMLVTDTGSDLITGKESPYFTGALLEGDSPQNGELLDFVRMTHLFDKDRSGALYMTASDSEAPYLDVIDGMGHEKSLLFHLPVLRASSSEKTIALPLTNNVSLHRRLVIAFKVRSSKPLSHVPLKIGYTNGAETDGTDYISADTFEQYRLSLINIDYPAHEPRKLTVDLSAHLSPGDWCEISCLNVIPLSAIATFSDAAKARVGKVTGIIDPVFGHLEGYGAYFQNLYAARNVNIAGTLTAGDESGFSSTFYVGKIHKNVIPDSVSCLFSGAVPVQEPCPVNIGKVVKTTGSTRIIAQTTEWRTRHEGRKYTFSIWVKSLPDMLSFYQNEHFIKDIEIQASGEWCRYKATFTVRPSSDDALYIRLESTLPKWLAAPQMESGENISQYQPTDGQLSYTEDYGAWFNRGGIGGTIQNPLLRLEPDGSIHSRDGSFVINADGTGHFADGKFRWTKDDIELRDITLRWADLDEQGKEQILSQVKPTVEILTDHGDSFINGSTHTTLIAYVFRGAEDITDSIEPNLFVWKRVSMNPEGDTVWNEQHNGTGRYLSITKEDVFRRAMFTCEVTIN